MCSYLIKKFNKSVTLFLFLENIISFRHVKIFQNFDWKNMTLDPKKVCRPSYKMTNITVFTVNTNFNSFIRLKNIKTPVVSLSVLKLQEKKTL